MYKSILAISIAVLFLGCQVPVTTDPGPGPSSAPKTGDLLASIPLVSAKLPKSLQDGTTNEAAGLSRALGDVTTLDPANIGGVRADGYNNLKQQLKSNIVSVVMSLLKAAVAGKDIPLDVDYTIGVKDLPPELLPGPNGTTTMDLGVIRLTRPAADTLEAKWTMKIEATMSTTTDEVTVTYNQVQDMRFFLRIVGNDPARVKTSLGADVTVTGGPQDLHLELASKYDGATGELTQVQRMGPYGQLTVLKNQNGFVEYYSLAPGSVYVAYANDEMGGVVAKHSGGYSGISTEYYDGQGDLVLEQWGQNNAPEVGWLPSDAFNLKTLLAEAPASITIRRNSTWTYHSDGTYSDDSTYQYSLNGTDFTTFTNGSDGWSYVWKAGSGWSSGDDVYYQSTADWTGGSNSYDEETGDWVYSSGYTTTYQIGYTVPEATPYLGDNYYMQNTFPLKGLRLSDELASKYALKMKEDHTYYDWKDEAGDWQYESDEDGVPAGWTAADPYSRWSWTNYDFWMENLDTSDDPARLTDSDGFPMANPGLGDVIPTNIENREYWTWDPTLRTSLQTKAVTVNTTLATPVGFAFEHQSLVTSVKSSLETLYQSIGDESVTEADLKDRADAIIVMPELETFPVLPAP